MIQRSTLREQLADALREEILAGRLAPGGELTVREIAEQYGVSATPVREALVDLSAQGLLEIEQHRGFRIRQYTLADFREMLDAQTLVTKGVLHHEPALALPGATPEAFTSMHRRAQAARQAALAGDLDVFVAYDLRFWRELTALLGNPHISEFLDRLRVRCWAFAVPMLRRCCRDTRREAYCGEPGDRRGRRAPDLAERLWTDHPELADAVERRDFATAERLLREHRAHVLQLAAEIADG